MRIPTALVAVVALSIGVILSAGCTADQVAAQRDAVAQIEPVLTEIDAAIADLETNLQIPGLPPEVVAEGEARLSEYRALSVRLRAQLDGLEASLANAGAQSTDLDRGAAVAQGGIGAVAPFLPPPWNAVSLFIGGALASGASLATALAKLKRDRDQIDKDARSVVRAIETAKKVNESTVDFGDENVKATLRSAMTDSARERVEQYRKA